MEAFTILSIVAPHFGFLNVCPAYWGAQIIRRPERSPGGRSLRKPAQAPHRNATWRKRHVRQIRPGSPLDGRPSELGRRSARVRSEQSPKSQARLCLVLAHFRERQAALFRRAAVGLDHHTRSGSESRVCRHSRMGRARNEKSDSICRALTAGRAASFATALHHGHWRQDPRLHLADTNDFYLLQRAMKPLARSSRTV